MPQPTIKEYLTRLLLDVAIARRQGDAVTRLSVLLRSALFYPVFRGWPSPVDEWLDEGIRLSNEEHDVEAEALLRIRRAVLHMRRLELAAALRVLEEMQAAGKRFTLQARAWMAFTHSRVLIRQHQFDSARRALTSAPELTSDDWVHGLQWVAEGELALERNELNAAENSLREARQKLSFELVEERILVLQSLGLLRIAAQDPTGALVTLEEARQLLIESGIWSEVIQMNVVTANFHLILGQVSTAEQLLNEARVLTQQHPQSPLEPLLQLSQARLRSAQHEWSAAIESALRASTLFAEQGNPSGYLCGTLLLHFLLLENGKPREAYRVLAVGLSVARRLKLHLAERILRSQVNRMRDQILGPAKFDHMVQEMIQSLKME